MNSNRKICIQFHAFDVTAFVRGENKSAAAKCVVKNLFDLTTQDLEGFDAVVDAFGAWTAETIPQHSTSLEHLCDILSGTKVRLLIVGGAGSLFWLVRTIFYCKDYGKVTLDISKNVIQSRSLSKGISKFIVDEYPLVL